MEMNKSYHLYQIERPKTTEEHHLEHERLGIMAKNWTDFLDSLKSIGSLPFSFRSRNSGLSKATVED